MLEHLSIDTVHGLIGLVQIRKQLDTLRPRTSGTASDELLDFIAPETEIGKAVLSLMASGQRMIAGMPREHKIELVALMYLGRDGCGWSNAVGYGQREVDSAESNMPVYMISKCDLDEYLDDGLAALGLPRVNEYSVGAAW